MEEPTGKRLTKSTSGLRMVPTSEKFSCPFALEEPMWIPDKQVPRCTSCDRTFDFLNRRHHCRRCGKCYCNHCSSHNMMLQRMYFVDPVRHCYECAVISKSEEEFYSKSLNILIEGSQQNIEEISEEVPAKGLGIYCCKLTPDQRCFEFSVGKSSSQVSPAFLTNVVGVQVLTESKSEPGKQAILGMRLKYKNCEDSSTVHSIVLRPVDQKSVPWVACAHKVLKMTFESRSQTVHE